MLLLYQQRDHFLIALLATALQHGRVILPPNLANKTLSKLIQDNPNLMILGGDVSLNVSLDVLNQNETQPVCIDNIIQQVKRASVAFEPDSVIKVLNSVKEAEIWLYTSGSTGQPKKVIKTWASMMHSAELAIERFKLMQPIYMVATVPPQHMFGLETSIFWPFFSRGSIWFYKPRFPEQIDGAFKDCRSPTGLLVSTPLHLKNLIASSTNWPENLVRVLSATAPLTSELAKNVESKMAAKLFEVYGSTETASIASRQVVKSEVWQGYTGIEFKQQCDGSFTVKLQGLDGFQKLNDQIEPLTKTTFKLGKRSSDLVKVAGKRSSLSEMNTLLQTISGVDDGVFLPCTNGERLVVFVVSNLSKSLVVIGSLNRLRCCAVRLG